MTGRDIDVEGEPHPEIAEAIEQAVTAGVFRRAARLNPKTRKVWDKLAEPYSEKSRRHLAAALRRAT